MENLTKAQLQAVCNQKSITYKKSDTKSSLIAKINGTKIKSRVGSEYDGEY